MYSIAKILATVILLESLLCHVESQLPTKYIKGSLADSWNFNITFFSTDLRGALFHFVDYELNILLVSINKDGDRGKNLSIRYNNEKKIVDIKSLCGCSPCEYKMMNLFVKAFRGVMEINCNKYGHDSLSKADIAKRENNRIPKDLRETIDQEGPNNIHTKISLNNTGCFESLYYNIDRIHFEDFGNGLLTTCPRSCPIGDCHGGKCRALDPSGPMCDCSDTELKGAYCNKSMVPYIPGPENSFNRIGTSNDIYIRLTWKQKIPKKDYCLLDFVNAYGQVTLTLSQNFVLKGAEVLSSVDSSGINYIDVNVTSNGVIVKINNKLTSAKPALFGDLVVNVGFSEKLRTCTTFEGKYYFFYNSSQLRPKDVSTTTVSHPTIVPASVTGFKIDLKIIFFAVASSILVTIVFLIILVLFISIRRCGNRERVMTENLYDVEYQKRPSLSNTDTMGLGDYEVLDNETVELTTPIIQNSRIGPLPEIPPDNSIC